MKNNKITKHILYIGLNDKDTKTQQISTLDAYKIIQNTIQAAGYTGATITEATGFYIHDNGTPVIEKSLRVEIMFATNKTTLDIIQQLKKTLNQESIALQVEKVDSFLI